jgi:hypothetical protein
VWVALLFVFRVFLIANWHTFWRTVGGFGGCEIRKSRHKVGFFVLVISEGFHRWEIGGMHGISCQSFAYLGFLPFSHFHNSA